MRSPAAATATEELASRRNFAKAVYSTDNLTALIAGHAGMGSLINQLRERGKRPPSALEREDLLLAENIKNVLVRTGVTCTAIQSATPPLVLVSFGAVVAWHRLPDEVREALEHGVIGLGEALRPYGVRRHTTGVRLVDAHDDLGGDQLMRVNATLSLPGVGPVALVDEIVYSSVLR